MGIYDYPYFEGLSCGGPQFCFAASRMAARLYDGATWRSAPLPWSTSLPGPLACPSSRTCFALANTAMPADSGSYNDLARWNAGTWVDVADLAGAGQSGNFELNVMLPVIARNLLESIELMANVSRLLADKAIATFKVNEGKLKEALARNPILVTALNPIIGYLKAAEIAKTAYKQGRPIIDVALEHTDLSRDQLEALLDPEKLTAGGI
jgi:hypothetical protein